MNEERFELLIDSEWWLVRDNNIKSDKYRDDLTGDDVYRGLQEGDLTEKEVVEYLNNFYKENQTLNNKLDVHLYLTEQEQMKVRGFIKKIEKEKEDAEYELLYLKEGYEKLIKENDELKQQLKTKAIVTKQYEAFVRFRIKLIEVLQKNYDYAFNQRQKNLDDVKIAHAYDVLRGTVKGIADDMGVDLE